MLSCLLQLKNSRLPVRVQSAEYDRKTQKEKQFRTFILTFPIF